jgi:hypothetical protein
MLSAWEKADLALELEPPNPPTPGFEFAKAELPGVPSIY